eukprot:496254-Prymnesium_polylepis.1
MKKKEQGCKEEVLFGSKRAGRGARWGSVRRVTALQLSLACPQHTTRVGTIDLSRGKGPRATTPESTGRGTRTGHASVWLTDYA